ncbi:MAG: hypothetical protein M3Y13_11815 [Armatimonadota bacterium]|nr:hypothetical protein [Armatimonadota bacterium]
MAGTVVGVFSDKNKAEEAAQALLDDGVELADITLVRTNAGGETGSPSKEGDQPEQIGEESLTREIREVETHDVERPINTVDEAAPRAIVGLVIGATLGSLAVSLLVFFQVVSVFLSNHALAGQLMGGIGGGIGGGILGAVTSGGIPEEAARTYHEHVKRGDTLVTVLASSQNAPHMQEILQQHGGRRLGFFTRFLDSVQSLES